MLKVGIRRGASKEDTGISVEAHALHNFTANYSPGSPCTYGQVDIFWQNWGGNNVLYSKYNCDCIIVLNALTERGKSDTTAYANYLSSGVASG